MLGKSSFPEEANQSANVHRKTREHKRIVDWAQHGYVTSAWTQSPTGCSRFNYLPPPLPGIGGGMPIEVAKNAGAERLEAENVAAFAAEIFRSPIAPVSTSKTRATTDRHLDIDPPEGKLTRREYM